MIQGSNIQRIARRRLFAFFLPQHKNIKRSGVAQLVEAALATAVCRVPINNVRDNICSAKQHIRVH